MARADGPSNGRSHLLTQMLVASKNVYTFCFQRQPDQSHVYSCHVGTCYDVITSVTEPASVFSVGEDGTVRWFDLRAKDKLVKYMFNCYSLG